ncbi:DUF3575 domain-containing protein [Flavobacterium polysaccharolyticum]|uniref:DUF3575 domain-containing protein n=1 Tax=Flavobacterium polysaccharolyticum TaxID=3133148 RepID=A0ABU9NMG4_9FLAO
MKKILVLLALGFSMTGIAQENEAISFKKNELKGNALFLVLGAVEATYERIITNDSGLGISLFFVSNEDDFDTNFILSPYYRAYFGKKQAAGFFVEGFSSISTGVENKIYYSDSNGNVDNIDKDRYTDLALGFGIGSKWIHKRGFVFEINAGIGRNLFSDNSPEVIGRGGITLGYRF